MLLIICFIFLVLAVIPLYLTAVTLRDMKSFIAHLGTHVTTYLRSLPIWAEPEPSCRCQACAEFEDVNLTTASKHKLLPRLAGVEKAAHYLTAEVEEFLAEHEASA
jgi:hypothetical protein